MRHVATSLDFFFLLIVTANDVESKESPANRIEEPDRMDEMIGCRPIINDDVAEEKKKTGNCCNVTRC